MAPPVRSLVALSASLLFLCVLLASGAARAHPPHAPFLNPFLEDTRFAPITSFGPKVSLEVVADGTTVPDGTTRPDGTKREVVGMTAPLKAVAAPGLPRYLFVVDQPGILWIVDLRNRDRATNKRIFLDVRDRIVTLGVCGPGTFDERGLLGVAFAPDFAKSGKFYTFTSERRDRADRTTAPLPTPGTNAANADHHNVVAEWRANPANLTAQVNPATRREILHANWPQFNHDGGDLAFGRDGMLYISFGDGGGADDADDQLFVTAPPHYPVCTQEPIFGHQRNGNAQKLNTVLGKILRIDVSGVPPVGRQYRIPDGRHGNPFVGKKDPVSGALVPPEIWALGFRNPYRFSFDRRTDDLYVGDVGQNDIEEVDIVEKGGNFGWNCKEGTAFFYINGDVPDDGFADESSRRPYTRGDCTSGPRPFIDPVGQYDTHREGHSVIGGYVYHGDDVPALRGKYVFGDFSLLFKFPSGPHDYGRLFTMSASGHKHGLRRISELMLLPGGAISLAVLGIGQDTAGEIYVTGNTFGVPFPAPGNDEELGTSDDVFNGKVVRLVRAEDARDKHDHRDDDDDDDD